MVGGADGGQVGAVGDEIVGVGHDAVGWCQGIIARNQMCTA